MIVVGDCVDEMAKMPQASVDAVVCDPPYGLEFMGKDWDRFADAPRMTATQKADHMNTSDSHGPWGRRARPIMPNDYGHRNERCLGCGKWRVSSNRCECVEPQWEYRTRQAAPPSMLAFQAWSTEWAREALRVLKPGGHLLAFGGTRTYHRLACAIEDAGFEVRDCLSWLYGSGFPKSLDVSKAIDKAAGVEREVVAQGAPVRRMIPGADQNRTGSWVKDSGREFVPTQTAPATPDAEAWQGWGTALKPAFEPIVLARKPLAGTVAGNVLAHGTGALNIDGCRVATSGEVIHVPQSDPANRAGVVGTDLGITGADRERFQQAQRESIERANTLGRWPANVVLSHTEDCRHVGAREVASNGHHPAARGPSGYGSSVEDSNGGGLRGHDGLAERHARGEVVEAWECSPECPVRMLDEQTGELRSGQLDRSSIKAANQIYGARPRVLEGVYEANAGGASRFFYTAKASRAERNAGMEDGRNAHPTVKPIDLMRWLVRLVTPPGGVVLDPFVGSGTTGCAAALEGFDFIGIERDPEYAQIAEARVRFWREHPTGLPVEVALEAESRRREVRGTGQLGLIP